MGSDAAQTSNTGLLYNKAIANRYFYIFYIFGGILYNGITIRNKTEYAGQHCFRAIPHKDCATDASSNFSSDETKSGVNT